MRRYYLSKLGQALVTIALVVLVVFTLLRFMPTTGYFTKEEYREMDDVAKNAYLRSIGVLDPTLVQLKNFLVKLSHGDLGRSMTLYPKSQIKDILSDKIKYSVMFNAFSWIAVSYTHLFHKPLQPCRPGTHTLSTGTHCLRIPFQSLCWPELRGKADPLEELARLKMQLTKAEGSKRP